MFTSRQNARKAVTRGARKAMKKEISHTAEVDMSPIEVEDAEVFGVILAQLFIKQRMKDFGERADDSIMKEFGMLHDNNCWIPRDPSSLTREERVKALSTVFL